MSERGPGSGAALRLDSITDEPSDFVVLPEARKSALATVENIEASSHARMCEQMIQQANDSQLSLRARRIFRQNLGMEILQTSHLLLNYPHIAQQTIELLLAEIEITDAADSIDADAVQKLARDIACQFPAQQAVLLEEINRSRVAHGFHTLEQA